MPDSDPRINLLWLSEDLPPPNWDLGAVIPCQPLPVLLTACLAGADPDVDAWLLWDPILGSPPTDPLPSLLGGPADLWHAGLKLGLAGQPEILDFVTPTWMLNRDPDPEIPATSWRLSLRACLVRGAVLRQMGPPDPNFDSLDGAGIAWGYRLVRKGVFPRHQPDLVAGSPQPAVALPLVDQLRFLQFTFDRRWQIWASIRAVLSGAVRPLALLRGWQQVRTEDPHPSGQVFQRDLPRPPVDLSKARVSVLIPTLHRYPYLRTLLKQLRHQTTPPYEILVVDQTRKDQRDPTLMADYADLPLRYLPLDRAGQCSSRNHGLRMARGDYILFIDDDDEVPPDLLQKHLAALQGLGVRVSSGVAQEVGAGELPADFRYRRVSSVFPTNNTLIRKSILGQSGLFDLAYERGQRADHDLGMRLYLAGELMVLNPHIQVLHHHAPQGGLRQHKARVSTYAAARRGIFAQNLPTVSDLYLALRYFSNRQVREMRWISLLGTFSLKGSLWKRLAKFLVALFSLPYHLWRLHQRHLTAQEMLKTYPQIPQFLEEESA